MNARGILGNDFDMALFNNDTSMIGTFPIGDGVFELGASKEHPTWVKVINIAHTTVASVGFTANMMTFVTIVRHGKEFSMAMARIVNAPSLGRRTGMRNGHCDLY